MSAQTRIALGKPGTWMKSRGSVASSLKFLRQGPVGFIVWLDAWCCIPGCSHDLLGLLQLACRIGNFITRGPINTEQQLSVEEMVPNAAEIIADIVAEATEQRAMLGDFGNVEGVRHPIARNKLPR